MTTKPLLYRRMGSGQKRKIEDELSRATAQPPEEEAIASATARGAGANAAANPTAVREQTDDVTEDQRRLEDRRAYNRANSARARLRSKQQIASLQATVDHQVSRLQEREQRNIELTEAVRLLNAEKISLQQIIHLLVQGEMGASSSMGDGGVPQGPLLDSASRLQGGVLLAPNLPQQHFGNASGSSSSLQQGFNSMQLLASLGETFGGGFRDNRGQGLTSAAAGPSTAMPANAHLESIRRLGDSQLHPYLGSLSGAQSQPDSQRAAILSALFGNTTTTTTQSTGWNIDPAILHHLQTLGVPLHQTVAAVELLLSRQQHQGGRCNDASENPRNQPTR